MLSLASLGSSRDGLASESETSEVRDRKNVAGEVVSRGSRDEEG